MEIGKINLTGEFKISSAKLPVSVIKKIEKEELKETAYDTEDTTNDTVEAGTVTVLREGQNRIEKTVYNLLDKEIISEETTVLQEGENRILEIGTKPIVIQTGTVDLNNIDTGHEWLDEFLEGQRVWQEYYESVAQGNPITKPAMVTGVNDLALYPISTPFPASTTKELFHNFEIRNIMGFSVEPDTPFVMDNMFYGASKIKSVPFFDTSNATSMNSAFSGCTNLSEIPLLDTSNVTSMNSAFYRCTNLSEIPLLDTSNVINMNSAFNGCTNLSEIPLLDTSNVTSMQYAFNGCTNLSEIPLLDTSNVTSMRQAFRNCANLTSVPALNLSSLRQVPEIFRGCTSLTDIGEFKISSLLDPYSMFSDIPNLSDESLNNILAMFIKSGITFNSRKNLKYLGFTETDYPVARIEALENYQDFINAGWTIGY